MLVTMSDDHCSPSGFLFTMPTLYTPHGVPINDIPSRMVEPIQTPVSHLSSKLPTAWDVFGILNRTVSPNGTSSVRDFLPFINWSDVRPQLRTRHLVMR